VALWGLPQGVVLAASPPAPAGAPSAEPGPDADAEGAWVFANPFEPAYADGPGWLRLGLQVGSFHRDGIGPSVTLVPWEYLELTVSYGYRTDHSVAGLLAVPLLPRALLTPYATAGYALAFVALPEQIRLYSHQLVAGLGIDARVADRYVVGVEVTGNGIFSQILQTEALSTETDPGERFSLQGGFHLGVHLP
jgi:hypothetical protein